MSLTTNEKTCENCKTGLLFDPESIIRCENCDAGVGSQDNWQPIDLPTLPVDKLARVRAKVVQMRDNAINSKGDAEYYNGQIDMSVAIILLIDRESSK